MVLSIWNRLSVIPGYSHPTGSKKSQKAECVGRNQIEKNYFLTIPAISRCPNKNGEAANSHLQAREPHLDSMFSRARQSIQALLNLVSWPRVVSMLNSSLAWGRKQAELNTSCDFHRPLNSPGGRKVYCLPPQAEQGPEFMNIFRVWHESGAQARHYNIGKRWTIFLPTARPIADCTIQKWNTI